MGTPSQATSGGSSRGRVLIGAAALLVAAAGVAVALLRPVRPPSTGPVAVIPASGDAGSAATRSPTQTASTGAPSGALQGGALPVVEQQAVRENLIHVLIDQHPEVLRGCYREAERRASIPPGNLELGLVIGSTGSLVSYRFERGPTQDPVFGNCLGRGLLSLRFPPTRGDETLRMTHSFRLPPE